LFLNILPVVVFEGNDEVLVFYNFIDLFLYILSVVGKFEVLVFYISYTRNDYFETDFYIFVYVNFLFVFIFEQELNLGISGSLFHLYLEPSF